MSNVWSQSDLNPTATHTVEVRRAAPTAGENGGIEINIDAFQYVSKPRRKKRCRLRPTLSSTRITASPLPSSSASRGDGSDDDVNQSSVTMSTSSTSTSTSSTRRTSVSPTPSPSVASEPETSQIVSTTNQTSSSSTETSFSSTETSSSSSSSNSTTFQSSTSTIRTTTSLLPVSSSSTSAVTSTSETADVSSQNQRAGIIIGTIAAVVITLSLLTICIVWSKRRYAKKNNAFMRASTTPAYRTTSVSKGLLPPLGAYNRRSGNSDHVFSFTGQGPSPIANTMSSHSPSSGPTDSLEGPISNEEGPSRFYLYPATPPPLPGARPRQRYTESVESDYPYPLAYNQNRPPSPSPSPR